MADQSLICENNEIQVSDWSSFTFLSGHICRLCTTVTKFLVPIYTKEGVEYNLNEKINKFLPVKVKKNDEYPLHVCYQCVSVILAWDKFINICLESDRKLKLLKSEENKGKSDEDVSVVDEDVENNAGDSDNEPLSLHVKRKFDKMDNSVKRRKICSRRSEECSSVSVKTEVLDTSYSANDEDIEESNEQVSCEHCDKTFKNSKQLASHVRKKHKEVSKDGEIQKCEICGNIYKTKTNLKRHYENEHMKNQVECPVCKSSINSKKLEVHLKVVHGVKTETEEDNRFQCKFCSKGFKNKFIRNIHVREVHMSEPMKCDVCGFEGVKSVVQRHKREVHCEKKYPCSVCGVPFKTFHTLKMHQATHSELRCFTCELCGMGFKRLNNVRDHMKCHEQKSNQCQICGNFFARKRYLAIHEKTIHNFYADGVIPEEKGFECGTCGAKLKWKKNLLAHMRIHTGEKPYVCKICKKDFICHGSLRSHMAKHGVCTALEKGLETLMSPLQHNDLTDLHPQIEMHCF